jgi:hypothetical protein
MVVAGFFCVAQFFRGLHMVSQDISLSSTDKQRLDCPFEYVRMRVSGWMLSFYFTKDEKALT